ncbi:type II secretion system protein M [Ectopseudomonas mendocina]|uniref:Type II secretion system protein M n=1 Tax=Ectopseudomonas mendocina TaxID=300 RepID=A0ABZ2RCU2_ECTME
MSILAKTQGLTRQFENSQLLQRWRTLAPREQVALGGLLMFLVLVLLYLALWQPAQKHVQQAKLAFESQRDLHAYMQANAERAKAAINVPQVAVDPARLQGLVTSTAAAQGLMVERVDSDGSGVVQVNLRPAPFAQLLRWFTLLQEQGVGIAEAGLNRGDDNLVTARLSLRVAN